MKQKPKRVRRQIFVLTLEEKKAVACVLAALALGAATKHYRNTHPRPPPPLSAREQYIAQKAEKAAKARARSARGQAQARAAAAATPMPAAVEDDE